MPGVQAFQNTSNTKLTAATNVTYATADTVYPANVGYYNVRTYGAVGDGSTDDTAAIQAAMADALGGLHQPNHGAGSRGSTVYFPSGTYLVSDSLVWATYGHQDAQVTAQIDPERGCVTGLNLLSGGSGYGTSWSGGPSLRFTGGGGSGVDAYTRISNGSVTGVVFGRFNVGSASCAGSGYTSAPKVTVLNWRAYLRFEGQNKDTTFIRLKDHTPAFANANCNVAVGAEKTAREVCPAVIYTASEWATGSGGWGEDAYENDIWNLTVQTGSGNPGAIALDWVDSNRGSVKNVNLVSGDGSGRCGLNVSRSNSSGNGPGYIKNVSITGFDYGIDANAAATEVGLTFEHVNLVGQKVYGVLNGNMPNWFRSVSSNNTVPVFVNQGVGSLTVVDGQFASGDSGTSAILDQSAGHGGLLYLRNVATSGYSSALAAGNAAVSGSTVAEYSSNGVSTLFASAQGSLNLPVEETPEWVDNNFNDWADVSAYGVSPNTWKDVTAGIQAALNSGKPVIYFPYGTYVVSGTLHIPSTVRKIVGSNSGIGGADGAPRVPTFSCESQSGNPVEIRNFTFNTATLGYPTFLNGCSSPLVLANILNARGYGNTSAGTGNLYLEDTALPGLVNVSNQQVWARQLDIEDGVNPHMAYTGGSAWILGYKTEGASSLLSATNSRVEVIGTFHSNNQSVSPLPAYTFTDTPFSLAGFSMYNGWPTVISESRAGVVKTLGNNGAWQGGPGFGLFSGHP